MAAKIHSVMEIKLTSGRTLPIEPGTSILEALKASDVYLVASCGGKGTCGKCRVKVIEGDAGTRSLGKLTEDEKKSGITLACTSFPKADLTIEIPESSRLVVGSKIAMSKAEDLKGLIAEFGASISPLVESVELHMPPPTLHDNISDIERMRRALEEKGVTDVRFSHGFTLSLAHRLRKPDWKVALGITECREAIFARPLENAKRYGVAVDIGTTTVVAYLVDLSDGTLIDAGSTYNSQMRHGDDVITRIVHATETPGGLDELHKAVVGDINDIITAMTSRKGISSDDIESFTISGNTTMAHLFWALDPGYIREEPYIPTLNSYPLWMAGSAGLKASPQAPVYTFASVASYVGGDIVSGVLASRMHRKEEIALFMDIGTNGEIALGNSEWLVAAACSAGPCFEGSGIRHGMRATEGAIESVKIDPETLEPVIGIIGGTRPMGICGSGMIDAISQMLMAGVMDQRGKFVPEKSGPRLRTSDEGPEYILYEDAKGAITLTEVDIENIMRAKAAIYAGVSLLVAEMGLTNDVIEKVYIAGGFGNYLNIEQAIILGMLPDMPRERFEFIGNSSVTGAYLTLLSKELREEANAIASKMTYIELSVSRGFMDEYMSAMFLPHTDMSLFPTVAALLGK